MKTKIWTDPIVDEVHKIRKEMAREVGNDMHKLVARLQESQRKHGERLITRKPRRLGSR